MTNYNETSFALVGILEQVNAAILNLNFGLIALSDIQQDMLSVAGAILQFSVDDTTNTYTSLSVPALSFITTYTGASSLTLQEVQDFQTLLSTVYNAVSLDTVVADSASLAYADILGNSENIPWAGLIDGTAVPGETVIVVGDADPFADVIVTENYILIDWNMADAVDGAFAAVVDYGMVVENSDGSEETVDSAVYVYVECDDAGDVYMEVDSAPIDYTYIS